jgi:two-component system, NtrC family, sensor histidine kinase HydH
MKRIYTRSAISPWIIIGSLLVLLPLVAYITTQNLSRQKTYTTRLLVEKGAALIRSFEAGTRFGMRRSGFKLQKLLTETARQPDIDYFLIVDGNGRIMAHSDMEKVGQVHGLNLDLNRIMETEELQWRMVSSADSGRLFEVYRKFTPSSPPMGKERGRHMMQPPPPHHKPPAESPRMGASPPAIIFVGLDMSTVEAARAADDRQIIISGILLLLAGMAGILLLFVAQSYRSTKASLSRVRAFSDTLVENMPMGVLALDHLGQISFLNPVAEEILDLSQKENLGRLASQVLPESLEGILADSHNQTGVVEKEIEYAAKNGATIQLAASCAVLESREGTMLGHIMLLKDLRDVHALRKEVARTQRLAALGSLAAGVAHEIRNPLSSIKGFATFFKEKYEDRAEDRKVAGIMIQEVDRLNRVVTQLLEFARPVAIRKKQLPARTLIQTALDLIREKLAAKKIVTQLNIEPRDGIIAVDPDRFDQVLLNLYLNAVDAMPNGGTLQVDVLSQPEHDDTEIRISDSGHGIAPQDLGKVFDPYFTTKSTGTGLGLAIVSNIIEAHGGSIRIENRMPGGTMARILLPHDKR